MGVLSWPSAEDGEVVSVDCPHGGTARRSCQDNMWTVPVLDCSSQVSAKVEQFLDSYVKLQVCQFVRRIRDHGLIIVYNM